MIATPLLAATLLIGYYGPADPAHPLGGSVWQGVQMAIEEARSQGVDVRLVQQWDENPWSGGARGVVRMAYQDHVLAIIGSINGAATHLAEQVVAKARLPLIDPASTDRTANAAFVPWIFSVLPGDRVLMRALVEALPGEPFLLLSSTAHDARVMTREFLSLLGTRRPLRHLEFERPENAVASLPALAVHGIVVLAPPAESARVVRDLRAARPGIAIYGSQNMGRRTFLEQAGAAAEGVRFPLPAQSSSEFQQAFHTRWNQPPDYAAAAAYDAARLLLAAIRRAGPNRAAIRDRLLELSPYQGVTGAITWDKLRRNSHPCPMAEIRHARVTLLPR